MGEVARGVVPISPALMEHGKTLSTFHSMVYLLFKVRMLVRFLILCAQQNTVVVVPIDSGWKDHQNSYKFCNIDSGLRCMELGPATRV